MMAVIVYIKKKPSINNGNFECSTEGILSFIHVKALLINGYPSSPTIEYRSPDFNVNISEHLII